MNTESPEFRALLAQLSDGSVHSLAKLAKIAGSHSALQKACQALVEVGSEITMDDHGVKMVDAFEPLDARRIEAHLQEGRVLPVPLVTVMFSVGSTNTLLATLTRSERQHGMTYLAEHQSAGKGRAGRKWVTPLGGQVAMSTCLRFPSHCGLEGLSLAVGVVAARALRQHGVGDIALKWPNDVLLKGKKLAGILIQILPGSRANDVIVGLGMNYALGAAGDQIDQPWADLLSAMPKPVSRDILAADLIRGLIEMADQFQLGGYEAFKSAWEELNAHRGKEVVLSLGQSRRGGIMVGTDRSGAAVIMNDSSREVFHAGEVSLRHG